SRITTAGLNVPALSHPLPRGTRIGVSETRFHPEPPPACCACATKTKIPAAQQSAAHLRIILAAAIPLSITICDFPFRPARIPAQNSLFAFQQFLGTGRGMIVPSSRDHHAYLPPIAPLGKIGCCRAGFPPAVAGSRPS